jgi:hypothetical protein
MRNVLDRRFNGFLALKIIRDETGVDITATEGIVGDELAQKGGGMRQPFDHGVGQGPLHAGDCFGAIFAVNDDFTKE